MPYAESKEQAVPSVHKYKRLENSAVRNVKSAAKATGRAVGELCRTALSVGKRRYTVMLVPHSEKRVYNLHINLFTMATVLLALGAIIGSFFWYGAAFADASGSLAAADGKLKDTQASLDQLRDETARMLKAARGFEAALGSTLGSLGLDKSMSNDSVSENRGDLASFFELKETVEGNLKEVAEVRRLAGYLSSAVDPVKEIGNLLDSQSTLLTDIPNFWPIKGGIGHISMFFGQNENPFTGQWYIHKGVDISTYRQGDPILATADGQVVTVDYDLGGFGNYIIIKHKHGFYTRYAHLQSFRIQKGQKVQQGQVIGYIGNTGLSTGPHLHYEVHIGSDVVDPMKYLNIRSSLAKATR
ncbi:MAG: peptidase M23 [Treponema sp. GWB1_62_6]|nr:MAG: peptidase M23 [Treponema sp. GWB1_62_6]OHE68645.1 MAG: peptidase M23 [Treponema sp. GWC1_61_84]OHE70376.1 MAG: peptidase M23 [Treponema sp. RIFOXYC1_FULL_61_9]HCM26596.1 peptidase M23 [Treponema sp.]